MLRVLALSLSLSGLAPSLAQIIAHGKAKYIDADFAEAIATLDEALARPEISPAQKLDVSLYVGFCQVGLGNDEAARGRFREVLRAKPDTKLPPGTSPKIRDIFERVRAEALVAPSIEGVQPVMTASPFGPGRRVHFKTNHLGARATAMFYWRVAPATTYTRQTLSVAADGSAAGDIDPHSASARISVEYFAEIREGDTLRAQLGNSERPLHEDIVQPTTVAATTPVYKQWWLWTLVGVAAGGIVAGTYFGVTASRSAPPLAGTLQVSFQTAR